MKQSAPPQRVPLIAVHPSTYNPRRADAERLDLVALSLRKLGWLLPLYADAAGEVLSGHQRHGVATRLGHTHVPVVFTEPFDEATRRGLNIAFNRATNDLEREDSSQTITEVLHRMEVERLAAALPDRDPADVATFFRCLPVAEGGQMIEVPTADVVRANSGLDFTYSRNLARVLRTSGITMPIVTTPDMKVVNGGGRLVCYAERHHRAVQVVVVEDHEAELAGALLNLLSMDFDVHTRYENDLRHNSFRRARRRRNGILGRGLAFPVVGKARAKDLNVQRTDHADLWKATCGTYVCDIGAGHLQEAELLRTIGVGVATLEPYRTQMDDTVDKAASVTLARAFLDEISAPNGAGYGRAFSSVFLASVLNSVPFRSDREHLATLTAALATPPTGEPDAPPARLYVACSSVKNPSWRNVTGGNALNKITSEGTMFALQYEPGITIGDFRQGPKVQKFHTAREIYDLLRTRFDRVKSEYSGANVEAIASRPRPVDPEALAAAIAFEFDLPYPDGSRMGLVQEARAAFEARLGIVLPDGPSRV